MRGPKRPFVPAKCTDALCDIIKGNQITQKAVNTGLNVLIPVEMHYLFIFFLVNSLIYWNNLLKTASSYKTVTTSSFKKTTNRGLDRPLNSHLTHPVLVCGPLTRFPRGSELHRAQRTHLPRGAVWATRQMSTCCRINAHLLDVQPRRRILISCSRMFRAPRRSEAPKDAPSPGNRFAARQRREKKSQLSWAILFWRRDTNSSPFLFLSFHLRRFP